MNKPLAAFAVMTAALFSLGGCHQMPPAPTTTIMPGTEYMVVVQNCKNYAVWRKGYAEDKANRTAAGLTEISVAQDVVDENQVILVFKISDLNKAKIFAYSPELKAHMLDSGVIGKPDIYFVHDSR